MDLLSNYYSYDPFFESSAIENQVKCFMIESEILDELNNSYIFEASEENEKSKSEDASPGIIQKIMKMIDTVRDYIVNLFKSIGSMFGKQLSVNDYMSSETVEIKLTQDIEKLYQDSKDQINEGHKFLKAINNATDIDMDALNSWKDKITGYTIDNAGPALSTAATVSLGNLLGNLMFNANDKLGEIKKKTAELDKKIKNNDKRQAKIYKDDDRKLMYAYTTVASGFSSIFRRVGNARASIERSLSNYKRTYDKNKHKRDKKIAKRNKKKG